MICNDEIKKKINNQSKKGKKHIQVPRRKGGSK
jgi:hypothetical protein